MATAWLKGVLLAAPYNFCICLVADFTCQRIEIAVVNRRRKAQIEEGREPEEEQKYNKDRTMIFSGVGGVIFGPMSYSRFLFLDFLFPDSGGWLNVVLRTICSSLVYTPLMTAVGMSSNEILAKKGNCSTVWARLRQEFFKILLAGYMFKVFTTFFSMSFTGTTTKYLVGQMVGMLQDMVASWRIYTKLPEEEEAKKKSLDNANEAEPRKVPDNADGAALMKIQALDSADGAEPKEVRVLGNADEAPPTSNVEVKA